MTTGKHWVTAGLVFLGTRDFDIVKLSNSVGNVLDALGETTKGTRILSDNSALVKSQHFDIWLKVEEDRQLDSLDHPVPMFLSTKISRSDATDTEPKLGLDTVKAHLLHALNSTLTADYVQWTSAGALLKAHDFALATAKLSLPQQRIIPTRPSRSDRLPAIEETNDKLQAQLSQRDVLAVEAEIQGELRSIFREDPDQIGIAPEEEPVREETAALRLSAWMVAFTVAIFSLPVGVALIVFNFLKGENLRLTSQTAALTGTFIGFQAFGTTAQAMNLVQNILG